MKNASCVNGTIEIALEQIQRNIAANLRCQNRGEFSLQCMCVKALITLQEVSSVAVLTLTSTMSRTPSLRDAPQSPLRLGCVYSQILGG